MSGEPERGPQDPQEPSARSQSKQVSPSAVSQTTWSVAVGAQYAVLVASPAWPQAVWSRPHCPSNNAHWPQEVPSGNTHCAGSPSSIVPPRSPQYRAAGFPAGAAPSHMLRVHPEPIDRTDSPITNEIVVAHLRIADRVIPDLPSGVSAVPEGRPPPCCSISAGEQAKRALPGYHVHVTTLQPRVVLVVTCLAMLACVACPSRQKTRTVPEYTSEAVIDTPSPALAIYIEICRHHIVQHWRPPATSGEGDTRPVVVGIRIDREGRILESQVVETSGNEPFDSSALAAVQAVDTLPPPPDEEVWELARQGIFVKFRETVQAP